MGVAFTRLLCGYDLPPNPRRDDFELVEDVHGLEDGEVKEINNGIYKASCALKGATKEARRLEEALDALITPYHTVLAEPFDTTNPLRYRDIQTMRKAFDDVTSQAVEDLLIVYEATRDAMKHYHTAKSVLKLRLVIAKDGSQMEMLAQKLEKYATDMNSATFEKVVMRVREQVDELARSRAALAHLPSTAEMFKGARTRHIVAASATVLGAMDIKELGVIMERRHALPAPIQPALAPPPSPSRALPAPDEIAVPRAAANRVLVGGATQ